MFLTLREGLDGLMKMLHLHLRLRSHWHAQRLEKEEECSEMMVADALPDVKRRINLTSKDVEDAVKESCRSCTPIVSKRKISPR